MFTDAKIAAHLFQPERLTLARGLKGISKAELADRIGKSVSSISQFEAGKIKPDSSTIKEISLALSMRLDFFSLPMPFRPISIESCHFRSLRSARSSDRREVLAHGTLLSDLVARVCEYVDLPEDHITPLARSVKSDEEIEVLASEVRRAWGLGLGPIDNLMRLVESKGAVVSIVPFRFSGIDAFSTRHGGHELIFLMADSPASRLRFDLAHELGHLILHQDAVPGDRKTEDQANRFASAFLMPRETFGVECPHRLDFSLFYSLKQRWRVSVAALIRRAKDLGKISEATYSRGNARLGQLGQRTQELHEFEREQPSILRKALAIAADDTPVSRIAGAMGITQAQLGELLRFNGASSDDQSLMESDFLGHPATSLGSIMSLDEIRRRQF